MYVSLICSTAKTISGFKLNIEAIEPSEVCRTYKNLGRWIYFLFYFIILLL